MEKSKKIALVAHDNCKRDLIEWVEWNWNILKNHRIVCTGTTGKLVEEALNKKIDKHEGSPLKHKITKLFSGPLGGDQQLGAMVSQGEIDILIFFWDPMMPQPHEVDVKALLRITVLYNVPTASNRSTADFMISSELFNKKYDRQVKDYSNYMKRQI
jgi:methylglyoxal synthase